MNPQILIITPVRCLACGALASSSRLFTVEPNGDRSGRHLKPATTYFGSRTLEKLQVDTLTTPICTECVDARTCETISDRESYHRWQLALRKKQEEERAERKAATKTIATSRNPVTLDDLV